MLSVKKILLTIFLFFFLPSNIFAAISINSSPTEIKISEEKAIDFSGKLDSNTDYYFKVRAGKETTLNKAQTYNSSWLNDTDAWTSMPTFKSNSEGTISGQLKFKFKTDAETSTNNLELSFRKVGTSTNDKSNQITINVLAPDPTPTPSPSSSPTPTPTSAPEQNVTDIRINEVYPCPKNDGNEWVEIYNNHDFEVNLNDWYIKDSADNSRKISGLTIAGKSFIYFAFGSGFLNNDGDTIRLFDNKDKEKYVISEPYPLISEDLSWAYVGGSWCIAESTKGSPNTICFEDEKTTPKPINKAEDEKSRNMLLAKERDLPDLEKNENEATVAGIATIAIPRNNKPNLTIPIIIASAGLLILGGASFPFIRPKLAPLFAKFKKKKKE